MAETKLNLSAPWEIFYKKLDAMFGGDPEITININRDTNIVMFYVRNTDKAEALTQLLPEKKEFGNITVEIRVVPANNDNQSLAEVYETAFKDNPAFIFASEGDGTQIGEGTTFVVFAKEVVQYFNDSLDDINRVESTLYQEIAKDIFDDDGTRYCTDYSYRAVAPRYKRWSPRFNYNKERNI